MEIGNSDYKKLVAYYGVPKSKEDTLKELGEKILATHLCVCVSGKKISPGKKLIDNLVRKSELRLKKRVTYNNVTKKVSSPKRKGCAKNIMKTKKNSVMKT